MITAFYVSRHSPIHQVEQRTSWPSGDGKAFLGNSFYHGLDPVHEGNKTCKKSEQEAATTVCPSRYLTLAPCLARGRLPIYLAKLATTPSSSSSVISVMPSSSLSVLLNTLPYPGPHTVRLMKPKAHTLASGDGLLSST